MLLITTGTKEDYEAENSVCVITMPQAPEGYAFIETFRTPIVKSASFRERKRAGDDSGDDIESLPCFVHSGDRGQ